MDDVSTIIKENACQSMTSTFAVSTEIFSIRLNEKIPHTQLLSELAGLDCLCVIEEL